MGLASCYAVTVLRDEDKGKPPHSMKSAQQASLIVTRLLDGFIYIEDPTGLTAEDQYNNNFLLPNMCPVICLPLWIISNPITQRTVNYVHAV